MIITSLFSAIIVRAIESTNLAIRAPEWRLSAILSYVHHVACASAFSTRMHTDRHGVTRHDGGTVSAFRTSINLISPAFNRPVRAFSGEFNLYFYLPLRALSWNDYRIIWRFPLRARLSTSNAYHSASNTINSGRHDDSRHFVVLDHESLFFATLDTLWII